MTIGPEMRPTGKPEEPLGPSGEGKGFEMKDVKGSIQPLQTEMKAMMAHVKVLLKDASGEDATKMKGLMAKLEGLKDETDPAKLRTQLTALQESNPTLKGVMANIKSQGGEVMKLPEQLQPAMAHVRAFVKTAEDKGVLTADQAKGFNEKLDGIMAKVNDHSMKEVDATKALDNVQTSINAVEQVTMAKGTKDE